MARRQHGTGGGCATRARRRWSWRRLLLLGAVPLLAASLAVAATLGGINARRLGAGASVVASCDTNGVTLSYTYTGALVSAVTVAGLADPACEGAQLSVTLANSAKTSIGAAGPTTIPTDAGTVDNSVTLNLNPDPTPSAVASIHVLVNGP